MIGVQHRNGRVIHGEGLQRVWMPWREPTCFCAYDASPGLYVKNGAGVSKWTDITGSGRHMLQSTALNQPVWSESNPSLKGLGSITAMTATYQCLLTDVLTLNEPCYCFSITVIPPVQTYNAELFDGATVGGSLGTRRLLVYSPDQKLHLYSTADLVTASTFVPGTKVAIVSYFSGSSTSALYVNSVTAVATGSCGTSTIPRIVIGNTPGYPMAWGAPIHYLSWFSGTPTVGQIARLLRYASNKVGIAIS